MKKYYQVTFWIIRDPGSPGEFSSWPIDEHPADMLIHFKNFQVKWKVQLICWIEISESQYKQLK